MTDPPRISIVTPSYNQAEYLEAALDSVLSQGYPNLDYRVLDGGSTDGSVEIIRRHERHLSFWCSEPDGGPWAAVCQGAAQCEVAAQGEATWFNWLNADDMLLPGSLALLAELIQANPDATWITGARLDLDAEGRPVASCCPWISNPNTLVFREIFLPQDATFMRLERFRAVAPRVPADLHNLFDVVLFRLLWAETPPLLTTAPLSAMRWHPAQRTARADRRMSEADRADVRATRLPRGSLQRLLHRLSSTRLAPLARGIAWQLASQGAFGLADLQACVFEPWSHGFVRCSVAEAIRRGT